MVSYETSDFAVWNSQMRQRAAEASRELRQWLAGPLADRAEHPRDLLRQYMNFHRLVRTWDSTDEEVNAIVDEVPARTPEHAAALELMKCMATRMYWYGWIGEDTSGTRVRWSKAKDRMEKLALTDDLALYAALKFLHRDNRHRWIEEHPDVKDRVAAIFTSEDDTDNGDDDDDE